MLEFLCAYVFLIPLIEFLTPNVKDFYVKILIGAHLRLLQIAFQIFLYTLINHCSNNFISMALSVFHFLMSYLLSVWNFVIIYSSQH